MSVWAQRLARYGMFLRALFNFVAAQSYRQSLFEGMQRGEALMHAGVRVIVPPPPPPPKGLPIAVQNGAPGGCLLVGSIGDTLEDARLQAVIAAFAKHGVETRLIALGEPPEGHEYRVRAALRELGVLPGPAQGLLTVLDGQAGIPLRPGDVVVVDAAQEAELRGRIADLELDFRVHAIDHADVDRLAAALPADASFPHRSAIGLGYRVLKPFAPGAGSERVCLFAHFDPDGRVDPYVINYLRALTRCGFMVLVISACELDAEALAVLDPLAAGVVVRQNVGLDFAGWALALELYPALADGEALLLANDSVYGPLSDLGPLMSRMDRAGLDLWGLVESHDIRRHFQSWFVHFNRAALRSPAFAALWADVLPLNTRAEIIGQYEVTLWDRFEEAGLKVGAAVGVAAHRQAESNPTMRDQWRVLPDIGSPFVKVQLLRDNPMSTDLAGWSGEFSRRGYPVRTIVDHLSRVRGASAAALRIR